MNGCGKFFYPKRNPPHRGYECGTKGIVGINLCPKCVRDVLVGIGETEAAA